MKVLQGFISFVHVFDVDFSLGQEVFLLINEPDLFLISSMEKEVMAILLNVGMIIQRSWRFECGGLGTIGKKAYLHLPIQKFAYINPF